MDTFVHVHVAEEVAYLADGISITLVVRQVNLLLFVHSHEASAEPFGRLPSDTLRVG